MGDHAGGTRYQVSFIAQYVALLKRGLYSAMVNPLLHSARIMVTFIVALFAATVWLSAPQSTQGLYSSIAFLFGLLTFIGIIQVAVEY